MRRTASLLALLACCAPLGAPAAALATPVPSSAVSMGFTTAARGSSVWASPAVDCILFDGGWNPFGGNRWVGTSFRPRGLLDVPGRRGDVIVPGEAIHIERIFTHPPKAFGAVDVGLQLAGRRAYLTGTIRPVGATSVRGAPRRRLARLTGLTLVSKASHGHLLVTVKGRATMLAPLAGTLERLRCKGPRERNRPIRAGQALGSFTAAIDPARATALAGSLTMGVSLVGTSEAVPAVEPTGGARPAPSGLRFAPSGLRFAWAPGTRAPAACSDVCVPDGGTLALIGGFDLVQGAQRLSFTDLAIAPAGSRYTVSATVAGARRTVATGYVPAALAFTPELDALLASTFGDPALSGHLLDPTFAPTQLAPV